MKTSKIKKTCTFCAIKTSNYFFYWGKDKNVLCGKCFNDILYNIAAAKAAHPGLASYLGPKAYQDVPGAKTSGHIAKDAVEDERRVPEHSYAQDGDPIQERIIRGMCFNNACALLNYPNGPLPNKGEVKELAEELFDEIGPWLRSGNS